MNITHWLNYYYPEFQSSVVLTTIDKINNIRSFLGRDLAFSIDSAVYQQIDDVEYKPIEVSVKNYIENFVNVLSCYFLHPEMTDEKSNSILYKRIDHFYIKTVLEGMRLQFPHPNNQVIRYSELYEKRFSKELTNLLSPEEVKAFLQTRELSEYYSKPKINLSLFAKKAIAGSMDVTKDGKSLFQTVQNFYLSSSDFITCFQSAMLGFIVIIGHETDELNDWMNFFGLMLENLLGYKMCQSIKNRNFNFSEIKSLKNGCDDYKKMIQLMRDIRLIYIKELYYHNTGVREIPDLNQVNLSPGRY